MPWLINAYYVEIEHAYQARAALAASDILVQYLILCSTIIFPFVPHCRLFIFAVIKCLYVHTPAPLPCVFAHNPFNPTCSLSCIEAGFLQHILRIEQSDGSPQKTQTG